MFFDTVPLCSVTGSTQGMVAGSAAPAGGGRRAAGAAGGGRPAAAGARRRLLRRARRGPGPDHPDRPLDGGRDGLDAGVDLAVEADHAGTHGIPDESTVDAMRLAGGTGGTTTDPVYEGESRAAPAALVAGRDATVLPAHPIDNLR